MEATNYFQEKMLKVAMGTNIGAPVSFYLALYRSNPTVTGSAGTEVSYSGYARQEITFEVSNSSSSGYIYNTEKITFPDVPSSISQTVTHIGVKDALTGGNMWLFAELADAVPLASALRIFFAASALKWTISGAIAQTYRSRILNVFKGTSVTGFTPYLALYNSSGVEKSGGSYARQQVTMSFNTSGSYKIRNSAAIIFPEATSSWGTVARAAIVDDASGGAKYADFTLESFSVASGDGVGVAANDLVLSLED